MAADAGRLSRCLVLAIPPARLHSALGAMKHVLVLTALALSLLGCATERPSAAPGQRTAISPTETRDSTGTNIIRVYRAAPDPDNEHDWRPLAFRVGARRFGTLEEFKSFVSALPRGSVVRWNSGCFRYDVIPLAHGRMSIEEFKEYCSQHAIEFQYVCGY